MGLIRLKKGLDLPIAGAPEQRIEDAPRPGAVAVLAADYPGMKPQMAVAVGDSVRRGQLLFEDKKQPGVRFTATGSGTVTAINRGAKRALQSVVIRLERESGAGGMTFSTFAGRHPATLSRAEVRDLLLESGQWTALRARPFGRVAASAAVPRSIFVTAMDSNPLAPDLEVVAAGREADFERGLAALAKLTDGPLHICRRPGSRISPPTESRYRVTEFAGPHPAGTAGVHIHHLDPVDRHRLVWYVGLQDVLAIGRLFETGALDNSRVISLAGPSVRRPRLLRTMLGASTDSLTESELVTSPPASSATPSTHRVISGSVLSGRTALGAVSGYLGRYHQQISVVPEQRERVFLGWLTPGASAFSITNLFLSRLTPRRRFSLGTSTNGSPRAIVPFGLYERVLPMDLIPIYLLKSLVMGDVERAEELGCLELEEEDLALCSFVCPGKIDYGPHLRSALSILEKEG
jgi:Na+-transporting NADH:ubiquinone oxidoreductase subunit A